MTKSTKPPKANNRMPTNETLELLWAELISIRISTVAKGTVTSYQTSWLTIKPFWGKLVPGDITQSKFNEYETWYLKTYPNRVFVNTRKHLVMFFKYLKDQKIIEDIPKISDLDKQNKNISEREKATRIYSKKEIESLLRYAPNDMIKLAINLSVHTGARKREIIDLTWENVDLENKTILLWSRNNQEFRKIPIVAQLLVALKNLRQKNPEKLIVIYHGADKKFTSQSLDLLWEKTKEAAGIEGKARFHDLRHTFATILVEDKWNPFAACEILDMDPSHFAKTYPVEIAFEELVWFMKESFG